MYPGFSNADKIDIDDFRSMLRFACRTRMMKLKKGFVDNEDDLLVVTAGVAIGTQSAAILSVLDASHRKQTYNKHQNTLPGIIILA
jgi:hypothetical protein